MHNNTVEPYICWILNKEHTELWPEAQAPTKTKLLSGQNTGGTFAYMQEKDTKLLDAVRVIMSSGRAALPLGLGLRR